MFAAQLTALAVPQRPVEGQVAPRTSSNFIQWESGFLFVFPEVFPLAETFSSFLFSHTWNSCHTFSVTSSVPSCLQCSVTCGSGEQTREVTCVGSGGMKLEEISCSALARPAAVRPCEMAACPRRISWHVGEWGLVRTNTKTAGTGFKCISCCFT